MSGRRQLMMTTGGDRIVTPVDPTGNAWMGWTFSASDEVNAARAAYKAFTTSLNEETGCWHSDDVDSWEMEEGRVWIRWNAPAPYRIKRYSLQSRANGGDTEIWAPLPQEWYLQGSNNGSQWTTLDHRRLSQRPLPEELLTFKAAAVGPHSMYRLLIAANFGASYVSIGRIVGYN